MSEEGYIYQVVDRFGEPVSGYNNTGGTYTTYLGATRGKRWAEGMVSRGRAGFALPLKIQRSRLDWKDV